MGVYIPNMEKPKSCYNHCLEDFIADEEIGCPLKNYEESHQYKNGIHPDCPLIDIVTCEECRYEEYCEKKIHRHGITFDINFCSYGKRK